MRMRCSIRSSAVLLPVFIASVCAHAEPPTTQPAPFDVFPASIQLETARDFQSVVVRVTRADGVTRDVTSECTFALSNPALARIDGHTLFPAAADGAGDLQVKYADHTVNIPIHVKDAKTD